MNLTSPSSIRPLNPMEESFAIMNDTYPLGAVIVLRLESGQVDADVVRTAIRSLKSRHPYLGYGISRANGKRSFVQKSEDADIPVTAIPRTDEHAYKAVTERALNTPAGADDSLLHVTHVCSADEPCSEVVLAFHHSLVDSMILRVLLDDLLQFIGGRTELAGNPAGFIPDQPVVLQRPSMWDKLRFMSRQIRDELSFRTSSIRQAAVSSSRNAIHTIRFSTHDSRRLLVASHQSGVSLNCLINAAMLLATIKHKHADKRNKLYQTITFANARSIMLPEGLRKIFGCFISMLRLTLDVTEKDDVISLGRKMQKQIVAARRTGDMLLYFDLSSFVTRQTIKRQSGRMATSALSFIGLLGLDRNYGDVYLEDVQAYISNNRLGPEFTGFGKLLFGRIGLDFCTLVDETPEDIAELLIDEVQNLLLAAAADYENEVD